MSDDIRLSPPPGAMSQSLRSMGYSTPTAIADLIDNSITAGASKIIILLNWGGSAEKSTVVVSDNGAGMTFKELKNAMTPGSTSPSSHRLPGDLGRFGLGMKTASWSMGRLMTVRTRKDNEDNTIRWDLDYVEQKREWDAQKGYSQETDSADFKFPRHARTGTIVHVARCDKIFGEEEPKKEEAEAAFFSIVEETRTHLAMVFHRFIENGLEIIINDLECIPWDPFMRKHKMTRELPPIDPLKCEGEDIRVHGYILPHSSNLSKKEHENASGPKGWNLQQGYYIYRANRLIVSGGWLGKRAAKPEEHTKLARVAVEISQGMDSAWNLNILKSEARPPANLRAEFGNIGTLARAEAKKAYAHKAKKSIGKARSQKDIIPMWLVEYTPETNESTFRINRKHELVRLALEKKQAPKKVITALLRNLEKTMPVAHIAMQAFEDDGQLQFDDTNEEKIKDDALLLYEEYRKVFNPEQALKLIMNLQPFHNHGVLILAATEAYEKQKNE
tara:strand:+ start:3433 stop:4941 length:1509 start_codon:yes stop_codon:yes gene_type:complete